MKAAPSIKKSTLTVYKTSSTTANSSDAADVSGSAASSLRPLGSGDEEAPDEDAAHHSVKKSKKKKKWRRRSKTKRSSSGSASSKSSAPSSDNSSCSSELFREAGSSTNGLANRVSLTATRRPGRLLRQTLQARVSSLSPLAPKLKSKRPAVVCQYLQNALAPQLRLRNSSVASKTRKSSSPVRNRPGNMRIGFRRSPTPLRESVHYKPRDTAAEVRALQDQQAQAPPQQLLDLVAPPAAMPDETDHSSWNTARQVNFAEDKGRIKKKFIPWNRFQNGRQARKGKGKSNG